MIRLPIPAIRSNRAANLSVSAPVFHNYFLSILLWLFKTVLHFSRVRYFWQTFRHQAIFYLVTCFYSTCTLYMVLFNNAIIYHYTLSQIQPFCFTFGICYNIAISCPFTCYSLALKWLHPIIRASLCTVYLITGSLYICRNIGFVREWPCSASWTIDSRELLFEKLNGKKRIFCFWLINSIFPNLIYVLF